MLAYCYRCFSKFDQRETKFKCARHRVNDKFLGPNSPHVFNWRRKAHQRRVPSRVGCNLCQVFTGDKACPACHADLPYYTGRSLQEIIAVAGCRATGKSVYVTGLIHQLRDRLPLQPSPYLTTMFEDDPSFEAYQEYYDSLFKQKTWLPATLMVNWQKGDVKPIILRLMRENRRATGELENLVIYDPPGELFQTLEDVRFVRYLANASGVLFVVDLKDRGRKSDPAVALGNIAQGIRGHLKASTGKLPHSVAVTITKADETVFQTHDAGNLIPDLQQSPEFWNRMGSSEQDRLATTSDRCRGLLPQGLIQVAEQNFKKVRYFTVSSLGEPPDRGRIVNELKPLGVECPLFWLLNPV